MTLDAGGSGFRPAKGSSMLGLCFHNLLGEEQYLKFNKKSTSNKKLVMRDRQRFFIGTSWYLTKTKFGRGGSSSGSTSDYRSRGLRF